MSFRRPIIGITPDSDQGEKFPLFTYYLRGTYVDALLNAGAMPLILPYLADEESIAHAAEIIDGLVISGGGHDLDPNTYGEVPVARLGKRKETRSQFELSLCHIMLELDKPLLGICGGAQVVNVASGGTLYQDIPSQVPGSLPHRPGGRRDQPSHEVAITPGSLLHSILKTERLRVNSLHHQAVKEVGYGFIVCALAPDGVVEGIERPDLKFAIGVQWHPEDLYVRDPHMKALFAALVKAASLG